MSEVCKTHSFAGKMLAADANDCPWCRLDSALKTCADRWQTIEWMQKCTSMDKAEIAGLRARVVEMEGLLKDIGDFAHDRSTGPAMPDDLWEIRRMAYDG